MGEGRLLLRLADWMQLATLVEDFLEASTARARNERKGDYAANVSQITPRDDSDDK